jgi:large subunit ribosomal protein L25
MKVNTIEAQVRPKTGKGAARRLRQEKLVPAICYGRSREPIAIAVDPSELTKALDPARGWNTVLKLRVVQSGKTAEDLVLVKDHQVDPIRRSYLHFDFMVVRDNEAVRVDVPVVLVGKPEGVKEGGILQQAYRHVPVEALPFSIPDRLEVDVNHLKMGQVIHLSDIQLPGGVKPILDPKVTLCSVVAPKEEKAAVEEAVAAEAAAVPAEGAAAPAPGAPGAAAPAATPAPAAPERIAPKKGEKK